MKNEEEMNEMRRNEENKKWKRMREDERMEVYVMSFGKYDEIENAKQQIERWNSKDEMKMIGIDKKWKWSNDEWRKYERNEIIQ